MKKLAFILLAMVCGGFTILAQSPGLFNYQAVVRNSNGDLIMNSDINFRISIREGSSQGTAVFSETQLVQSNSNGVCNLKIGDGNNITGSLSAIDWSSGTYFLQIETDASGGESFTETGTVQLLSVPYAMYANAVSNTDDADADSTNEIQDLNLDNNILTITGNPDATSISLAAYQGANTDNQELNLTGTDLSITGGNSIDVSSLVNDADADPTNELQNLTFSGDTLSLENGNHIIFPYDSSRWAINGQNIYYNTGNVGIGSSSPGSKLEVKADASFTVDDTLFSVKDKDGNIVFAVFPDGAKVYVNEGVKGRVGGFAVTGRNPTKAPLAEEEYLRVTPDSTRIWVTEDPTKARVGGFAVTGRNPTKGMSGDYLVVSSDSTRIYINDTTTAKRRVGGFAVTGRNPTKGPNDDYLRVTRDSTRVYITESTTKARVGGFAVTGRNPTKGDVTSDYFNVSGNTDAEIVNNEPRVMWYPKKGALLAGEVHVGSADSVGTNSMAMGFRSISMGDYSQALGYKAKAIGDYSTAIGKNAVAKTESSFAFGEDAQALNNESYAIGRGAIASGYRSFAFGSAGIDTLGVETDNTMALGNYSIALGQGSYTNANGAIAMGTGAKATQGYSFAAGYYTNAQGYFSTAFGSLTYATGNHSTAFGENTHATGAYSVAFGFHSDATNSYSFSFGNESEATHIYSWASGYYSHAYADYTTAIGQGLTANKVNEFVIGRYNSTVSTARNSWLSTDPLFIIGNGSSSLNPSNAFVVYKNGNTDVMGRLKVGSGNIAYATGVGDLYVADVLEVDNEVHITNELIIGDYTLAYGGLHVGSNSPLDPGTNNLIVDGTSQFKGATYFGASSYFNYPVTFNHTANFEDNVDIASLNVDYNCNVGDYISVLGGVHVGGTSDPGTDNLVVDGISSVGDYITALGGIHVGGTSDPGTDNLIVDGDVGLGITDPSGYRLYVYENVKYDGYAAYIRHDGNSYRCHGLRIAAGADANNTGTTYMIAFANGANSAKGSVKLVNGAIQYATSSDRRLKTNIIETKYEGLEAVLNLPVVDYELKDAPGYNHTGFIAQDLEEVFPYAVSSDDDGMLTIDKSSFVPILTKAIQEQQKIIETQNNKIIDLEERLLKLEELLMSK